VNHCKWQRRAGKYAFVVLVGLLGACTTGASIRAKAEVVRDDLERARKIGAYKCAPMWLALAERNSEFTEVELEQGNFVRAEEHLQDARKSIERALAQTDPQACAEQRILIKEAVQVAILKTDRDGDGITDDEDKCPDEPEDPDGFEDEDGCPDLDHDNDGILEPNDLCPNRAEDFDNYEDEDGCPEDQVIDSDGDGLSDGVDQCPADVEDADGYEDEDGCPDLDNDGDGVADVEDKCPMDPGPADNAGCPVTDRDGDGIEDDIDNCPDEYGVAENNGCPKVYSLIKVNRAASMIEVQRQVRFKSGRSEIIGGKSFELLRQISDALRTDPSLSLSIEGHTDSVGSATSNLALSDARAASVREYLVKKEMITDERLVSIGFGEARPLATNRTRRGRAKNRRVEFRIKAPAGSEEGSVPASLRTAEPSEEPGAEPSEEPETTENE